MGQRKLLKRRRITDIPLPLIVDLLLIFNCLASKRNPANADLDEARKALKAQQEADEAKVTEADKKRFIEDLEFERQLIEKF